jgi:Protein of unknown function (DUF2783)
VPAATAPEEDDMLVTDPNLESPDDFYEALIDAHRDLDTAKSHELNAKLVPLLANHVGLQAVLEQALKVARSNTLKTPIDGART